MFLASIRLVNLFDCVSLEEEAQHSYDRLNICLNPSVANKVRSCSKTSPKDCPLVWDMGPCLASLLCVVILLITPSAASRSTIFQKLIPLLELELPSTNFK